MSVGEKDPGCGTEMIWPQGPQGEELKSETTVIPPGEYMGPGWVQVTIFNQRPPGTIVYSHENNTRYVHPEKNTK